MRAIIVGAGYFHSFASIRFSPEGRAEFFDNGKRLKNKLRKQTTDAGLHCGCNNDRLTTVSDSIYV